MSIEQTIAAHTDALRYLADAIGGLTATLNGRQTVSTLTVTAAPATVAENDMAAQTVIVTDGSTVAVTSDTPRAKRGGRPRKAEPTMAGVTPIVLPVVAPIDPLPLPPEPKPADPAPADLPPAVEPLRPGDIAVAAFDEPAEPVSLEKVHMTMVAAMKARTPAAVKEVLEARGVLKVSALPADQLPGVYAALRALLGDDAK